jgi:hypothetical protein
MVESTLTERRAYNIQRNNALLSRLGMIHNNAEASSKSTTKRNSAVLTSDPVRIDTKCRGMIIPTCWLSMERQQQRLDPSILTSRSSSPSLQHLYHRYPNRSVQIRKLYSLLSVPIMATASSTQFVPPPIFVTGPSGSGKTGIVRDVVLHCCCCCYMENGTSKDDSSESKPPPKLPPQRLALRAYMDCGTLDSNNMEEFFSSAYSQWMSQIPSTDRNTTSNSTRKTSMLAGSVLEKNMSQLQPNNDMASPEHGSHNTMLTAAWMFGRSLQSLLEKMNRDTTLSNVALILIVDHAELLLSLGTSSTKTTAADRINVLAQLLLLPQTLGLNLTIIVITKNVLLEHTGTFTCFLCLSMEIESWTIPHLFDNFSNSALNKMNSQGTIAGHICPISIYFPAYREKTTIQAVSASPWLMLFCCAGAMW